MSVSTPRKRPVSVYAAPIRISASPRFSFRKIAIFFAALAAAYGVVQALEEVKVRAMTYSQSIQSAKLSYTEQLVHLRPRCTSGIISGSNPAAPWINTQYRSSHSQKSLCHAPSLHNQYSIRNQTWTICNRRLSRVIIVIILCTKPIRVGME